VKEVFGMLFKNERNWKEFLSIEDEAELNRLLERTARNRPAYKSAEDVKLAQLWCALIEIVRYQDSLNKRLARIEMLLEGLFEKEKEEKRRLTESLRRF